MFSSIKNKTDYFGRLDAYGLAYTGNSEALTEFFLKEGTQGINQGAEKLGGLTLVHAACFGKCNKTIKETVGEGEIEKVVPNLGVFDLLKQKGANLFQKDDLDRPPLFLAANTGKHIVLEFLVNQYIKEGKSTTEIDNEDRSAIHALCCKPSSPIDKPTGKELADSLRLLLDQYPDNKRAAALEAKDKFGFTPVDLAIASGYTMSEKGETELATLFKDYGIEVDPAKREIKNILPEQLDYFHRTQLMEEVFVEDGLERVKVLLSKQADTNQMNICYGGRTPLSIAAGGPFTPFEVFEAVVRHPTTNLMLADNGQSNVLHYAAYSGRPKFVELLFKVADETNGIRFNKDAVNHQDVKGRTPLHALAMATRNRDVHLEVLEVLLNNGAKYETKDENEDTAYDLAKIYNNQKIVTALEEHDRKIKETARVDTEVSGGFKHQ